MACYVCNRTDVATSQVTNRSLFQKRRWKALVHNNTDKRTIVLCEACKVCELCSVKITRSRQHAGTWKNGPYCGHCAKTKPVAGMKRRLLARSVTYKDVATLKRIRTESPSTTATASPSSNSTTEELNILVIDLDQEMNSNTDKVWGIDLPAESFTNEKKNCKRFNNLNKDGTIPSKLADNRLYLLDTAKYVTDGVERVIVVYKGQQVLVVDMIPFIPPSGQKKVLLTSARDTLLENGTLSNLRNRQFSRMGCSGTTSQFYLGLGYAGCQPQLCVGSDTFYPPRYEPENRTTVCYFLRNNHGQFSENGLTSLFPINDIMNVAGARYAKHATNMEGEDLRDEVMADLGQSFFGNLLRKDLTDGLGVSD